MPTKEQYTEQLNKILADAKSIMSDRELTDVQRKNLDKLAAITAAQAFKEQVDKYIEDIRKPAYEAAQEFLLVHK